MELERQKILLVRACYGVLVVAAAYFALRWLWPLFFPFLTGFAVAYLLRPATGFICRHSKISRRSASIISAIIFYALFIGTCWLLGALFLLELEHIGKKLPALYSEKMEPALSLFSNKLIALAGRFFPGLDGGQIYSSLNEALKEMFVSASTWGMGLLTSLVKSAPMVILTLVFTILSSVLVCADYKGVTAFVMRQIPARLHLTVLDARDFLVRSLQKIIKTYLILMMITFALLAFGLWLINIEDFMVYAAIIAFLDLLPVVGSGMVLIPWGIILIVTGNSFTGFGMLILWAFSSFVREFLEPKILGAQIGLHPLVALTSMYFGLRIAGFGGLILAPVLCLLICYLQDKGKIKLYRTK